MSAGIDDGRESGRRAWESSDDLRNTSNGSFVDPALACSVLAKASRSIAMLSAFSRNDLKAALLASNLLSWAAKAQTASHGMTSRAAPLREQRASER